MEGCPSEDAATGGGVALVGGADDRCATAVAAGASSIPSSMAARALDEPRPAVFAVAMVARELHLRDGDDDGELQGDEDAEG